MANEPPDPGAAARREILRVIDVHKTFDGKTALNGATFGMQAGELFTLLGPNGAGKTTLLKLICGLLHPTRGRIEICGTDLARDPIAAKRRLSFIPDHPDIYERLTGREYLAFVAGAHGLNGTRWAEHARELLAFFELEREADALIGTYSHGMRQRLCFVAAFLPSPALLLIDEPWVGLDPRHLRKAIDALHTLVRGGSGVLLSTHSLALAEEIGGRIGILHQGRFLWDGAKEDLLGERRRLEDVFLELTDGPGRA